MGELSKAEEVVLLAIWRLADSAYGISIRRQIIQDTGKDYTYGTLYGLLRQLAIKDLVRKRLSDPIPERGGRRKTYFELTSSGSEALKEAIEFHQRVWKGVTQTSFHKT